MAVISEPANVVGMTTCGKSVRSAIAFDSPIADPPPIATMPSACTDDTAVSAASVTLVGVCICAPG